MNERIEKLAEQAEKYADDNFKGEHFWTQAYESKFAELIVRECANMAESFHHHQYDFTGNLELHEFIREHFGVN
jgi:hypothetical protein